jgi:hypothetical protein
MATMAIESSCKTAINCIVDAAEKAYFNVRHETASTTIDKMVKFLEDRIEVDEELHKYFEEFRENMTQNIKDEAALAKKNKKKATKGEKKTTLKALTANNLFIQDKMAELKAAGVKGDEEKGNILKQANVFWKEMTAEEKEAWTETNRERLAAINKDRAENPEKYTNKKKAQAAVVVADSESE